MSVKKVILAQPRGFCAGVEMAVETVERALKRYGPHLYVFHEIVHNRTVVDGFIKRGVIFVESIDDVPHGSTLVFSAHGISPSVRQQAQEKKLQVILDATCPLVEKVHREVRKFAAEGYWVILVGHKEHDEIVGTSGEAPERIRIVSSIEEAQKVTLPDTDRIAVLTQTTLSVDDTKEIVDALRQRFPSMVTPSKEDICYATQNRQDAVKELCGHVDTIFVIGSPNSENSTQLCRVAKSRGIPAYLINSHHEINSKWLAGVERIGITSGASAPDHLVQEAVKYFTDKGAKVDEIGFKETEVHFALPIEIKNQT
ncbi:MAG: 4-hydroxy-3-methylbut-2-enyl diphosphate reductase [Deltaproteobacteria bacterium]|nr:4-hydroxy-3-methylbut-2-enyl diphosphate reductase [Deltaproteobacteria bacterium]